MCPKQTRTLSMIFFLWYSERFLFQKLNDDETTSSVYSLIENFLWQNCWNRHTHTQVAMICSSSFFCFLQKFVYNENWPSWFLCNLVFFVFVYTHTSHFRFGFVSFWKINYLRIDKQFWATKSIIIQLHTNTNICCKYSQWVRQKTFITFKQIDKFFFGNSWHHPSIHPSIESNKLMTLN